MTTRTYTLTFNSLTLDTTNLRMNKRGGQEVIDYFLLDETFTVKDEEIVDVPSFRKALEEGDETSIQEIDGDKTVVQVTLDLYPIRKPDPPTLPCMSTHCDGAHCGLGDWYQEIEQGIQEALNKGVEHEWTTGWYASKKEIASARITHAEGGIRIEASVSDDFDTPGLGSRVIEHTTDLEKIREAIYEAWEDAETDQKGNREYAGFSVHDATAWVETYIACVSEHYTETPPGDCYYKWGFQEECEIPEDVKEKLADWAERYKYGTAEGDSFAVGGFTIKPWD